MPFWGKKEKLIKRMKNEVNLNDAKIAKANKGNSFNIAFQSDYNDKIDNCISSKQFDTVDTDLTSTFQESVRNRLNSLQIPNK